MTVEQWRACGTDVDARLPDTSEWFEYRSDAETEARGMLDAEPPYDAVWLEQRFVTYGDIVKVTLREVAA